VKHRLLFDTPVPIEALRGRKQAIDYLRSVVEAEDELYMSVITVAELYAGVREGAERERLKTFLTSFSIIHISFDVAVKGGLYRRDYSKTHGVGLADALIAATAHEYNLTLVTLNKKHFPMIRNLQVPY
jgi:predicted nucleic acid-binding protein